MSTWRQETEKLRRNRLPHRHFQCLCPFLANTSHWERASLATHAASLILYSTSSRVVPFLPLLTVFPPTDSPRNLGGDRRIQRR